MVLLSVRGTAADGSRSRRPGRATEGRISSCAAQRSAGGLLPARGRVVLRPGGGGGVARALGAPEFGTLPPTLFTPIAEQLGLMGELTRLMLRLSLVQHRVWPTWPRPAASMCARKTSRGTAATSSSSYCRGSPACGNPDRGPADRPPARVSGSEGNPVTSTVSAGIAECGACRDLLTLLARADRAMYEAK